MPETKKATKKKGKVKKVGKEKKEKTKKTVAKKQALGIVKKKEKKVVKKEKVRYFETTGRRKTAVARVRFWTQGPGEFLVNDKLYQDYFPILELQQIASDSLKKMKCLERFKIQVLVRGGGLHAQAEAIRHGTARALVLFNPDFRKKLKRVGFLTRDPRMRERKKFGLKRARKAPQWSKR